MIEFAASRGLEIVEEICEVIIQVGHYTGWPTMSHAVRQFTDIIEEQDLIKQGKKKKSTLL